MIAVSSTQNLKCSESKQNQHKREGLIRIIVWGYLTVNSVAMDKKITHSGTVVQF